MTRGSPFLILEMDGASGASGGGRIDSNYLGVMLSPAVIGVWVAYGWRAAGSPVEAETGGVLRLPSVSFRIA
jgi:hypothetical protein